jgi:[acyl-carrier-protein] S-malonyltransferase
VSDTRTAIDDVSETDRIALVFPGQGSQSPGMGHLVYQHSEAARLTYAEASDVTQIDLTKLCFESDAETLSESRATQPAMLTTSVAILRAMREKLTEVGDRVRPRLFGGHSLGLFSAAVACEAISFRDALLVILERARLMGEFYERRPVGMASILALSLEQVEEVCADATVSEDDRVDVANHNQATQFVISGDLGALERAMERARELHGRAIQLKLKVSSHTPLHREQSEEFAQIVRGIPFSVPVRPIVSNSTSKLLTTADEVRHEFEVQLRSPVYWAENVQTMVREGVDTMVEVGPGHVLSRMVKRISDQLTAVSLDDAREEPIPISVLPQTVAR